MMLFKKRAASECDTSFQSLYRSFGHPREFICNLPSVSSLESQDQSNFKKFTAKAENSPNAEVFLKKIVNKTQSHCGSIGSSAIVLNLFRAVAHTIYMLLLTS